MLALKILLGLLIKDIRILVSKSFLVGSNYPHCGMVFMKNKEWIIAF